MKRRTFLKSTSALSLATLVTPFGIIERNHHPAIADTTELGFKTPPSSAKPHTWWHWMNGNVTKEGITLDLEAMARVGIGGFQNFDAGTGIPKGPIVYLSPGWLELKKHAISEARRLGLEFTMHNCPGWSSSGGPWITPELAMQEVTWSELVVEGGKAVAIKLPQPLKKLNYYKDIAVVAYKSLPGEIPLSSITKNITAKSGAVDIKTVTGEAPEMVKIEKDGFLQFEFTRPIDIRQVSFITAAYDDQRGPILLESSDDGTSFKNIATFSTGSAFNEPRGELSFSQNIPATRFTFLRLSCNHIRQLTQIRFSNSPRVDEWQKRGNFAFNREGVTDITDGTAIAAGDTIDITTSLKSDGSLTWQAPKGTWTILRFGFTPIGTMNRSAPDTGVGLECDKFSASAIEFHFNKMMEKLLPVLKTITENGKAGLLIDSYEVGMQNWTDGFEKMFSEQNGYPLTKYLPALTGRLVDNSETTDRFLWDYRRAQGNLMANNYYGKFTELCHKNKMISYCQPYDRGPMEEMQIGARVDTNVGEFWNGLSAIFQNNLTMRRTVKLSASIAHTNGQKVVAAESYTGEPASSKWQEYPFALKGLGDRMFTQGLNRMVFHRFAHQPHPTAAPGMTMGPWGSHFDRTNTWWEQGKAWMDYLSRCQYLLQEGTFVADLAYFTGEDAGVYTRVEREQLVPQPPEGYDYDLINAETIISKAKVVDGKLTLPDGTSYRILVLQDFSRMSLKLLKRMEELVSQGLVVVGERPTGPHGLTTNTKEFSDLVAALWDKGKVIANRPLETILRELDITPDFYFTSQSGDAPITWIHRKIGNDDVYFIANQRRSQEMVFADFRGGNKQPELWDPVTGSTVKVDMFTNIENRTLVPLMLYEYGSAFVVLREGEPNKTQELKHFKTTRELYPNVTNSFTISFWAKPESSVMLSTNNFMDGQKPWTDCYTIYPSPGEKLYGQGHATCGIAVGRNGVAVWEHAKGRPVFAFAAPTEISSWTHVALTYNDGVPSVYVNGELLAQGQKSNFIVHPGVGHVYLSEGASFYNGDMTTPDLSKIPLTRNLLKSRAVRQGEPHATTNVAAQFSKWTVKFPDNHGAPSMVIMDELKPLNEHPDAGVKYFSGTCTYSATFSYRPSRTRPGQPFFLGLGSVEVIADVTLNGKSLGIFWTRPYMIDITDQVSDGVNELVVKVTTLWVNRLIGDEQVTEPYKYSPTGGTGFAALSSGGITELPAWYHNNQPKPDDGRVAFTTWKHYQKKSPLVQSGLIGPIILLAGNE
ncbi:MAG TPA: glycosyl hydrolase [Cyclobacteriaceae bacterium]|nr:glycosyl hydrolase [Cyclobacteriaceae bacterium]